MTGPSNGLLVWSSGHARVLLASADGFRTFTNATPPAVPTDGGFALAVDGGQLVVGVRPTGDLTTSPFLVGDGTREGWTAGELPGAIDAWPHTVALQGGTIRALIGTGSASRLVESTDAGLSWTVVAAADRLDPSGLLSLTGVGWTGADRGWLSGVAAGGHPVLYASDPGSTQWHPVALASGSPAATETSASLPCGVGESLTTLLLTRGAGAARAVVERSSDGGTHWTAGAPEALPAGDPAWTCGQGQVWLAVPGPGAGRMRSSLDGGASWTDEGPTPGVVESLAIAGAGTGYAVTGRGSTARLWSVAGNGSGFTSIPLPAWVAKLSAGGES